MRFRKHLCRAGLLESYARAAPQPPARTGRPGELAPGRLLPLTGAGAVVVVNCLKFLSMYYRRFEKNGHRGGGSIHFRSRF